MREIRCICFKRLHLAMSRDDKAGHWWFEIGEPDNPSAESFGWWPKFRVSLAEVFTGVAGELNDGLSGQLPARDPHHGESSHESFHPLAREGDHRTDAEIAACLRAFALDYNGEWKWFFGWGQNCHTLQRVRELTKFCRAKDARDQIAWVKAFVESYEYWPSGRLRVRNLIRQDGTTRSWSFVDRPALGVRNVIGWCARWFGDPELGHKVPDPTDRLLACHEFVSQMESDVLDEMFSRRLDEAWAFQTIAERVSDFKELFQLLCPGSNPRISVLAVVDETRLKSLPGVDELFNLGALDSAWEYLATLATFEPADLTTASQMQLEGREWLLANGVKCVWAVPIRADSRAEDVNSTTVPSAVGVDSYLVLWLAELPDRAGTASVHSILQRLGHFVQTILGLATLPECYTGEPRSGAQPLPSENGP